MPPPEDWGACDWGLWAGGGGVARAAGGGGAALAEFDEELLREGELEP